MFGICSGFADGGFSPAQWSSDGDIFEAAVKISRDSVAPRLTAFSPADGMSNVAVGTNITMTFNESVKAGSGLIQIRIGSSSGVVVESFNTASSDRVTFLGTKLTIDPVNNLSGYTRYFVTVAKGAVVDLAGNSYAGTASYDFRTSNVDTSAPVVTRFSPADGSTNASVGANITLTFNETIKAGAGLVEIHTGSADGAIFESFDVSTSDRLLFSGSTLKIDPLHDLDNATQYFVTLDQGTVTDLSGNKYAGTATYDFRTITSGAIWNTVTGYGLLNVDAMLEKATNKVIADASPLAGSNDWGLNNIQAPDAWQAGYTGKGVIVAVVDTGVDYTHSDLGSNIWINKLEIAGNGLDDDGNGYIDDIYGYDFVNKDGYALDDNGHGTHVSGIIAGLNNGSGVTGVAYDATIMPVKVLNSSGSGSFSGVAAGVMYAVNNGANIISMSLGAFGASSPDLSSAITYAINHGVIVCMASGNDNRTSPTYPAVLAETVGGVAVGAVNSSNVVASFSNDAGANGPYDYVVAPGVNVYSTYKGGIYKVLSGTSMATPYVSGAAALLLSAHDDYASAWSLEQLENFLTTTAQPLGSAGILGVTGSVSTSQSLSTDSLYHSGNGSTSSASGEAFVGYGDDSEPVVLIGVVSPEYATDMEVHIV
ncbi:MAG: S8 family serine peptidase [Chlorobiaceae bacterium]|nr:S8 family serine peptidase [Chlorobiaceae bacterium]